MPTARALWRVRTYVRPHLRSVVFVVVSAAVGIGAGLALPQVIKSAIDGPLRTGDRRGLWVLAGIGFALAVVENTLAWRRRNVLSRTATTVETQMRDDLYRKLQRLHVGYHDQMQSGQLVQRAVTDLSTVRRFVGFGATFLVILSLELVVVIALLARLHLGLALLTAALSLPVIAITRRLERRYATLSRQVQDQEGDLTTLVEEAATGLRAIKAFGRRPLVNARFEDQARLVYATSLERVRVLTWFDWALGFVPNVAVTVVLFVGALAVGRGALTVGGLVAFILYLLTLVWPLQALGWILSQAEEAQTAAARIYEVLDAEPAIVERPGAVVLAGARGEVRFDGVRFAYPTGHDDEGPGAEVLRGIDLVIEPGETVALVGATGSGKTTLAMLLPRLYDVTGGGVTLDGHDVRDLTLASLRANVGVAFEDATLFSASVRDNLLLGAPMATDDDIAEALEVAQATFAYDLPWGLDTRIGEQGLSLSGGQRQRLALARAIIGRPRVLVLDDPLSALDVHTESLVEDALREVLQGVTALLVVHRPSTVALADRAALLWDGRIVATGDHGHLMRHDERYRAVLAQEVDEPDLPEEVVA